MLREIGERIAADADELPRRRRPRLWTARRLSRAPPRRRGASAASLGPAGTAALRCFSLAACARCASRMRRRQIDEAHRPALGAAPTASPATPARTPRTDRSSSSTGRPARAPAAPPAAPSAAEAGERDHLVGIGRPLDQHDRRIAASSAASTPRAEPGPWCRMPSRWRRSELRGAPPSHHLADRAVEIGPGLPARAPRFRGTPPAPPCPAPDP